MAFIRRGKYLAIFIDRVICWYAQTTVEILAEETGNIRDCMAQKLPWYPVDGDQFE